MSIEIEVCVRLADHWIDEDGKENPKYHAQIKDHPGRWSCGRTPDDAIGNLVRCHPEAFGIKIAMLSGIHR